MASIRYFCADCRRESIFQLIGSDRFLEFQPSGSKGIPYPHRLHFLIMIPLQQETERHRSPSHHHLGEVRSTATNVIEPASAGKINSRTRTIVASCQDWTDRNPKTASLSLCLSHCRSDLATCQQQLRSFC